MKKNQVQNIATCFKVSEDEVMKVVNENGGMEKATFDQVDGHFKALDWEKRKAEWKKFKGITIKFQTGSFYVQKGLYQNLKRFFDRDDIYVPEGWERSMSINGQMVTFDPCRVFGSKKCNSNDWYMYVKVGGTRQQMLDATSLDNTRIFLIPYHSMTRPVKEDGQPKSDFDDYMNEVSRVSFSDDEKRQWEKEKKLRFCTGKL